MESVSAALLPLVVAGAVALQVLLPTTHDTACEAHELDVVAQVAEVRLKVPLLHE